MVTSSYLGLYPEGKLMSPMAVAFLISSGTSMLFPTVVVPIYNLPPMGFKGLLYSTSLPTGEIFHIFFITAILTAVR